MPSTTPFAPPPVLPEDVLAFAAEQGVAADVRAVLDMTQGIFPQAAVALRVEQDAEIARERYIVLEVDVTGFDEHRLFEAQRRWTAALFQHCPAHHIRYFILGLVASA